MAMIDNQAALRNMTARRATTSGRLLRSMSGGLGAMVGARPPAPTANVGGVEQRAGSRVPGGVQLPGNSTSTQVPGGVQPPRNRATADGMQARGPGMSAPGQAAPAALPPRGNLIRPPAPPPTMGSGDTTAVRTGSGGYYSADGAETERRHQYGMINSPEGVRAPNRAGLYETQPTQWTGAGAIASPAAGAATQPTQWSGAGAVFSPAASEDPSMLGSPNREGGSMGGAAQSLLEQLRQATQRGGLQPGAFPGQQPRGTLTEAGPRQGGPAPVQGGDRQPMGETQSQRIVGDPEGQDSATAQEAERQRLEEEYRRQEAQRLAQQNQPRQEGDYTDQNEADATNYANQQGQAAQDQQQQAETTSGRDEWVQREDGQMVNARTGLTQAEQVARDRREAAEAEGYGRGDGSTPPLVEDPLNPGHYGRYGADGTFHPTNMVPTNKAAGVAKEEIPGMPDMGEAPQIDQAKINAMIAANAQERALAESRTLQAALSRAARSGMSPESATAMTGEAQHRSAIAGAQDDARVRSDAELQNFQANVQYFRDKQQIAADYAKMLAQIGASKDLQDRAIQASAYAAREAESAQRRLMQYSNELENRLNPNSLLGASLGGLTSMGTAGMYGG